MLLQHLKVQLTARLLLCPTQAFCNTESGMCLFCLAPVASSQFTVIIFSNL